VASLLWIVIPCFLLSVASQRAFPNASPQVVDDDEFYHRHATKRHKASVRGNNSSNQQSRSLPQSGGNGSRDGTETSANGRRKKRERHADVDSSDQTLLAAKLPRQEHGVRTRSQLKAELREHEHMLMTQSNEGKAVLAVQEIIALVNETKANGVAVDTITQDEMVYCTENMLNLQQQYIPNGINGYIETGYHYTNPENMPNIRQHGLLTRCERNTQQINTTFHGSIFGDGIYTSNNPDSFSSYGNTGVLVARLPGKMVRVRRSLPTNTTVDANTIVGDKMTTATGCLRQSSDRDNWPLNDANHEIVLRSSVQCVPMIKYDKKSRNTKKGKECIQNLEKGLLGIFDKYFNEGLQRGTYQDVEILKTRTSSPLPTPVNPPTNNGNGSFFTDVTRMIASVICGLGGAMLALAGAMLALAVEDVGRALIMIVMLLSYLLLAAAAIVAPTHVWPGLTWIGAFLVVVIAEMFGVLGGMQVRFFVQVEVNEVRLAIVVLVAPFVISTTYTIFATRGTNVPSTTAARKSSPSNAAPSTSNTLKYKAPTTLNTGIPSDAMSTPDSSCNMKEDCVICWGALEKRNGCAKLKCQHIFHKDCIQRAFQSKPECPTCRKSIGAPAGKCPSGTMTTTTSSMRCSGFREGSIVITYLIPAGRQMSYHDNPGTTHASKHVTAYIPK